MERDHLESDTGSVPFLATLDGQSRDPSQERLLQQNTNYQVIKEQRSRFKSLHRPRAYSTSSYASQPEEDIDAPPKSTDYAFPGDRGRDSYQPRSENSQRRRAGYVAVDGASKSLWVPFWLSKIVLICFLLLFAALLTALLLVWNSNIQRNGFYVADSTSPYTWTYGPTAVLVIVISLWRMVDYHCKTLTPWSELRNGPVVASKSIRLDYLSPLQFLSLLKALANGHFAVVATIVGFFLLKIIVSPLVLLLLMSLARVSFEAGSIVATCSIAIENYLRKSAHRSDHNFTASVLYRILETNVCQTVFSTGLFVLSTIPVFDSSFPVNTTSKFDPALASAFNGTSALNPGTISNSPVYSWYAHIAHGLPYSPGVSDTYAYQPFEAALNSPVNASITAEVDAFVVIPNCRVIKVKVDGPTSIFGLNKTNAFPVQQSLTLPDGDICKHWSFVSVPVQDPQHYIVPAKQITGTQQGVFCSINSASTVDLSKGPDAYLYTVTDVRYTQRLFPNASTTDGGSDVIAYINSTSRRINQMSNVLCQFEYVITRINVTNSTSAFFNGNPGLTKLTQIPHASNHTLPGLSARNLSSVFASTLEASVELFGDAPLNSFGIESSPQVPSTLFSLMAATQNSKDFGLFLDGQRMKSAAEDVFNGISLAIAQQFLMSPDQTTNIGRAVYPQDKLYVRPTSLWVMTACFGVLIILAIVVLFLAPSAVVSRDPSSIGAHAAILARSTDLNRELRKEGATQDRFQRSILSPHFYRASVVASDNGPPVFKVQVQLGGRPGSVASRTIPVVEWFDPLSLKSPVLLTMAVLVVGCIVALEFLQRLSDSKGLLTLPDDRFSEAYIHYIPALVMLLIATMFNSLDFNISVFAPFSALRSGYTTSRRTVMSHLLGKTPPFAVFEAFRSLQFGALLSLTAALVASVLTIVVSGLYSVEMLPSAGPARALNQLDVFNLTWDNSYASDNGAAATLSLVEHLNISYPDFTYGELVFPSLALGALDDTPGEFSVVSGPATASIPALRANLNCKILPETAYNVSTEAANPYEGTGDEALVRADFLLPPECQLAGYQRNQSTLQYLNTFELVPKGEAVYAGAQLDLLFGNGTYGTNYGENNGPYISDNPPGCPSLAFTFGLFKLDSTDRSMVTTMVCQQQIQQILATVTFLANSTTIDGTNPPTVDESTVKLLVNPLSTSGSTSFEYRIQQNLLNEFATFNGSGYAANNPDGSLDVVETIDIFFQAIIQGSDKVPEADLVGKHNKQRFYDATNRFYRKYMAQAINANMRKACPASGCLSDLLAKRQTSSSNLQATVSILRPRLVQSSTSKLVLQILLGVMLVCGTLAYLLTPIRKVLPCNPCTIAGTMALLAGSKLCWSSDETVCECCGKTRSRDADSMIRAVGEVDHHEERAEYIPHGAEWMSDRDLRAVFSKMRYTLGWWKRGYGDDKRSDGKRYGIDVGRADGLDDQDWELGRKRTRKYTDEERNAQRKSGVPNQLMGPLKEEEPAEPQIAPQLSAHQIRQSRMPEWMLGPLKPDKVRVQEHELEERRPRMADHDGALGMAQPQPLRDSKHHGRIPHWLLGPLKPDPQDGATRGANSGPEEAFASGAVRGPDMPGLGQRGP